MKKFDCVKSSLKNSDRVVVGDIIIGKCNFNESEEINEEKVSNGSIKVSRER